MLYRWPPPPRITHHLAGYQVTRWHLYGSQAPDITPTFPSNNFSRPMLTSPNVLFYTRSCAEKRDLMYERLRGILFHREGSHKKSVGYYNMVRVHCSLKLSWIDLVDSLCNINIESCTGAKSLSCKQIFSPPQPQNPLSSSMYTLYLHAYNSCLSRSNLSWSEIFYSFTTSLSEGAQNNIVKLSYYLLDYQESLQLLSVHCGLRRNF